MSNYTDYKKLKKQGDEGEGLFYHYLRTNGHTNIEHIDDVLEEDELTLSDWDFRATDPLGNVITYEVKTQMECHRYGFFNVEQVQNGKPAGIATSKADVWVFVNEELGFGTIPFKPLKDIHRQLCSDLSITKKSYHDKEHYGDAILWITKYENFACGFRLPVTKLKWVKQ